MLEYLYLFLCLHRQEINNTTTTIFYWAMQAIVNGSGLVKELCSNVGYEMTELFFLL